MSISNLPNGDEPLSIPTAASASHAHTTVEKLHWQTALIVASLQLPATTYLSKSLSRRIECELVLDHAEHLRWERLGELEDVLFFNHSGLKDWDKRPLEF